jgi:hypothetical protein
MQGWIGDDEEVLCDDCVERIVGGRREGAGGGRCESIYCAGSAAPSPHPPDTQGSCFDHHTPRTPCSSVSIESNARN